MVKCAAFNCRSGYRPTKAEREILEAGGSIPFNRSVFAFPKADRQKIRDRWIAVLRRKDTNWNPDNFGVCELHFQLEDFYNQKSTFRKTGRQRKALKPTAVPSVFDCYPDTAKWHMRMASLSFKHQGRDEQLKEQGSVMFKAEKVITIDDMWDKLSKEKLPSGYIIVKMVLPKNGQYVITIRLEDLDDMLGLPIIRRNLTIYPDLHYRMHVGVTEVSVHEGSKLTAKSGTFGNTTEVLNVLTHLKTIMVSSRDLMVSAMGLQDRVSKEGGIEESFLKCQFAVDLLRQEQENADDEKRIKEAEKVKRARLKPKAKKGEHAVVPQPEPLSEPEVEEDAGVGEALLPIVKVELPDLDSSVAAGINQDYDNGNFVEIKEEPIDVKTEPLDDMQIGEKLSAEAPSAKKSRSSFEEFCYKSDCNLEKSLGVIEDNKSNIIYIKEGCIKSEYGVDND